MLFVKMRSLVNQFSLILVLFSSFFASCQRPLLVVVLSSCIVHVPVFSLTTPNRECLNCMDCELLFCVCCLLSSHLLCVSFQWPSLEAFIVSLCLLKHSARFLVFQDCYHYGLKCLNK